MNMRDSEVQVQTVNASTARQRWSQLVKQVYRRENRVIVEKSGIPVAALISVDDFEHLQRYEAARRERFKALETTWEAFADVPPEELEHEGEQGSGRSPRGNAAADRPRGWHFVTRVVLDVNVLASGLCQSDRRAGATARTMDSRCVRVDRLRTYPHSAHSCLGAAVFSAAACRSTTCR